MYNAIVGNGLTANNPIRDTFFADNPNAYYIVEMIADLMTVFGSLGTISTLSHGATVSTRNIFKYADDQLDIPSSVWDEVPVKRGDIIDNADGLANNLGHNFPIVDSLNDGVLASTKSYDTMSQTYQNADRWLSKIKSDINKLNSFTSKTWNGVNVDISSYNSKQLNIVIPNSELTLQQQNALQSAKDYATSLGIQVKVYITK